MEFVVTCTAATLSKEKVLGRRTAWSLLQKESAKAASRMSRSFPRCTSSPFTSPKNMAESEERNGRHFGVRKKSPPRIFGKWNMSAPLLWTTDYSDRKRMLLTKLYLLSLTAQIIQEIKLRFRETLNNRIIITKYSSLPFFFKYNWYTNLFVYSPKYNSYNSIDHIQYKSC